MSRSNVYYWKCDRPAAFHGTQHRGEPDAALEAQLLRALEHRFQSAVQLTPAHGQGNHLTWKAQVGGQKLFIRVENGPERDNHLQMESRVMALVKKAGLPLPEVVATDATHSSVAFAWQALEYIPWPDLNCFYKAGTLHLPKIALEIGASVAQWQDIQPLGFGPFDARTSQKEQPLCGFHALYENYFLLRLEEHLGFLVRRGFLSAPQSDRIHRSLLEHRSLLALGTGCLVHKDLALWNILGTETAVKAFIDFDDAISGDPLDDLSLLACFHDASFLDKALEGYQSVRPLPSEHRRRFWMHLLRNMIVKAVIRVGAGYFERDSGFFLIGGGASGATLKEFTETRLFRALDGLQSDADISLL
ncbi:MAG: Fructosamine-3-kinase [Verrucomicrobia bacterium]|nr:MAG: Fructosamine-3-kinase [Verrucomicrobiota bacterium]